MNRLVACVAAVMLLSVCAVAQAQDAIPMPDDLRQELDRTMGDWDIEITVGELKYQGTYHVQWAPEQVCAIWNMELKELLVIGDLYMTGVIGWDPLENRLKTVQFNSLGDTSTILWSVTNGEWQGNQSGLLLGKDIAGYPEIRWVTDPNVFEYRMTNWTFDGNDAGEYVMKMTRKTNE